MKNFHVKLSAQDWQQVGKQITRMSSYSFASVTYDNYADVFNIQDLLKKIMHRIFNHLGARETIKISLTANEIRSLRFLVYDNRDYLANLQYETLLFININGQINKQEINVISTNGFHAITNFTHG